MKTLARTHVGTVRVLPVVVPARATELVAAECPHEAVGAGSRPEAEARVRHHGLREHVQRSARISKLQWMVTER